MATRKLWSEACQKKIVSPEHIKDWRNALREEGKTVATLNGSFDLLHAGHLQILFEASQQADVLLVALNSDASIQRYKSPDRPIIPLKERMQLMAALAFVGAVTWFEETTPINLLKRVNPDVHVNGAEYGDQCIEAQTVKASGGQLYLVEKIEGLSTSALIAKIMATEKSKR